MIIPAEIKSLLCIREFSGIVADEDHQDASQDYSLPRKVGQREECGRDLTLPSKREHGNFCITRVVARYLLKRRKAFMCSQSNLFSVKIDKQIFNTSITQSHEELFNLYSNVIAFIVFYLLWHF